MDKSLYGVPCSARLMVVLVILAPLVGCESLQLTDRRVGGEGGWNSDGSGPERSYSVQEQINPPLTEVWSYNANAGFGPGSALLSGGVVTVGNRKGEVHMIDVKTGRRLGFRGFGDAIEATPVLRNGTVFVPVAWEKGGLFAYDVYDGRMLWRMRETQIEAGLLLGRDRLFVIGTGSVLKALDPRSGEPAWERELDPSAAVLASPVGIGGERIAVVDEEGRVTTLNQNDGSVAWLAEVGSPVRATPSSSGGLLFVSTTRGRLVALDANTGAIRWRHALPDTSIYLTSPASTERDVVVAGSDGGIHSFDAKTGTPEWTFQITEGISAAPLITAEVVYVGGLDGKLYGLDRATGTKLWEQQLDGRIKSALAAQDGYVVALAEPRTVHLFKEQAGSYAQSQ